VLLFEISASATIAQTTSSPWGDDKPTSQSSPWRTDSPQEQSPFKGSTPEQDRQKINELQASDGRIQGSASIASPVDSGGNSVGEQHSVPPPQFTLTPGSVSKPQPPASPRYCRSPEAIDPLMSFPCPAYKAWYGQLPSCLTLGASGPPPPVCPVQSVACNPAYKTSPTNCGALYATTNVGTTSSNNQSPAGNSGASMPAGTNQPNNGSSGSNMTLVPGIPQCVQFGQNGPNNTTIKNICSFPVVWNVSGADNPYGDSHGGVLPPGVTEGMYMNAGRGIQVAVCKSPGQPVSPSGSGAWSGQGQYSCATY
jgi:hypothetical protein